MTPRSYHPPIECGDPAANRYLEGTMPNLREVSLATTSERQAVCLAQLQMLRQLDRQRRSAEA